MLWAMIASALAYGAGVLVNLHLIRNNWFAFIVDAIFCGFIGTFILWSIGNVI